MEPRCSCVPRGPEACQAVGRVCELPDQAVPGANLSARIEDFPHQNSMSMPAPISRPTPSRNSPRGNGNSRPPWGIGTGRSLSSNGLHDRVPGHAPTEIRPRILPSDPRGNPNPWCFGPPGKNPGCQTKISELGMRPSRNSRSPSPKPLPSRHSPPGSRIPPCLPRGFNGG